MTQYGKRSSKGEYLTGKPCRFLDLETRACSAYSDRFRAQPDCVSIMEGVPAMVFPADCPYTKGIPGYEPPIEEWDDPEVDETIRNLLGEDALPVRHKASWIV